MRLLRLYRSDKGVWRYDLNRDGKVYWSSLRTRDEAKARMLYAKMQEAISLLEACPRPSQTNKPPPS